MATFKLDEDEKKLFDEWNENHLKEHHKGREPYTGAAGGRVTFTVFHCGLGQIVAAYCGVCKVKDPKKEKAKEYEVCLTDFSTW